MLIQTLTLVAGLLTLLLLFLAIYRMAPAVIGKIDSLLTGHGPPAAVPARPPRPTLIVINEPSTGRDEPGVYKTIDDWSGTGSGAKPA